MIVKQCKICGEVLMTNSEVETSWHLYKNHYDIYRKDTEEFYNNTLSEDSRRRYTLDALFEESERMIIEYERTNIKDD